MPDPTGRMSQSVCFKTSIQTKRNRNKETNTDNLLNLLASSCGRTVFFRKVENSYWSVKTPWLSLLAECMSLYRETKKKVIGGIVAISIGYQWPSPPFNNGGTQPFLVPVVLGTILGTSSSHFVPDSQQMPDTFYCSRAFTSAPPEWYVNGYFQAINFFWND